MPGCDFIVNLKEIEKYYNKELILDRINLKIQKGEILGVVGPNGSGKSTLMKIILQLVIPSSGDISFFPAENIRVAGLLEKPGFYPNFSLAKNLQLFSLYQKSKADFEKVVLEMNLTAYINKKFKDCSSGIKRRAELASIFLNDPNLLILDEPSNGLDPSGIIELRNILKRINEKGCSIIITSHILSELEKICSRFCFIHRGAIRECGDKEMFLKKFNNLEDAYQYYTT